MWYTIVVGYEGGGLVFQAGDKIFYPSHGAGVVEAIEEKDFLGERHLYYVLHMLLRELQIMVPVEKVSALGIREVVDSAIIDKALTIVHEGEPDLSINPAQRFRLNQEKMKSGDICESAEVIRDLSRISRNKVLGTGDKLMLDNAQQLFISELMLVKGLATQQASAILKQAIDQ